MRSRGVVVTMIALAAPLGAQLSHWEWWKPSMGRSNPCYAAAARSKNLRYLLLKAQRMAATRAEFIIFRKAA